MVSYASSFANPEAILFFLYYFILILNQKSK